MLSQEKPGVHVAECLTHPGSAMILGLCQEGSLRDLIGQSTCKSSLSTQEMLDTDRKV